VVYYRHGIYNVSCICLIEGKKTREGNILKKGLGEVVIWDKITASNCLMCSKFFDCDSKKIHFPGLLVILSVTDTFSAYA